MLVSSFACTAKSESDLAQEALARGLEAHQKGRVEEARSGYREVLVHDPEDFAFYNLGVIDQDAGRTGAAEAN